MLVKDNVSLAVNQVDQLGDPFILAHVKLVVDCFSNLEDKGPVIPSGGLHAIEIMAELGVALIFGYDDAFTGYGYDLGLEGEP